MLQFASILAIFALLLGISFFLNVALFKTVVKAPRGAFERFAMIPSNNHAFAAFGFVFFGFIFASIGSVGSLFGSKDAANFMSSFGMFLVIVATVISFASLVGTIVTAIRYYDYEPDEDADNDTNTDSEDLDNRYAIARGLEKSIVADYAHALSSYSMRKEFPEFVNPENKDVRNFSHIMSETGIAHGHYLEDKNEDYLAAYENLVDLMNDEYKRLKEKYVGVAL